MALLEEENAKQKAEIEELINRPQIAEHEMIIGIHTYTRRRPASQWLSGVIYVLVRENEMGRAEYGTRSPDRADRPIRK